MKTSSRQRRIAKNNELIQFLSKLNKKCEDTLNYPAGKADLKSRFN